MIYAVNEDMNAMKLCGFHSIYILFSLFMIVLLIAL